MLPSGVVMAGLIYGFCSNPACMFGLLSGSSMSAFNAIRIPSRPYRIWSALVKSPARKIAG